MKDPFDDVSQAFAHDSAVSIGGKGFGSGALKANGKIFAMISSKGRFVVKLPRARVDELVALGKGEPFDPGTGKLMREWLAVSGAQSSWLALAREAREFVGARKPPRAPAKRLQGNAPAHRERKHSSRQRRLD